MRHFWTCLLVLTGVLLSLLSGCSEAEDEGAVQIMLDGIIEPQSDTSETWEFTPEATECEGNADCDDGIECTEDFCTSENTCEHILGGEFCLIEGECITAGTEEPGNVCALCDPILWTDKWSSNHNQPCDDGNPCTDNEVCNKLECIGETVTPCCGNGVVEEGETCDGNCDELPLDCSPEPCAIPTRIGAPETCDLACTDTIEFLCGTTDGCCPDGCDSGDDGDCLPTCGDGVLQDGELCDGDCPTSCDDGNTCTVDTLVGDASTCDAVCNIQPLNCDDGIVCTVDTCVADSGCSHSPEDSFCASGEPCITDTCDADAGCVSVLEEPCCGNGLIEEGSSFEMDCPGGYLTSNGASSYLFCPSSALTWEQKRAACQAQGGDDLVSFDSPGEMEFVAGILSMQFSDLFRYWAIGATDSADEGVWNWVSGAALPTPFTFCDQVFPSPAGDSEDCAYLVMDPSAPCASWNDALCPELGSESAYICESLQGAAGVEECDDGNLVDEDGCSNLCQENSACGNGVVDSGEECDDNNTVAGDGCDSSCQSEFPCGGTLLRLYVDGSLLIETSTTQPRPPQVGFNLTMLSSGVQSAQGAADNLSVVELEGNPVFSTSFDSSSGWSSCSGSIQSAIVDGKLVGNSDWQHFLYSGGWNVVDGGIAVSLDTEWPGSMSNYDVRLLVPPGSTLCGPTVPDAILGSIGKNEYASSSGPSNARLQWGAGGVDVTAPWSPTGGASHTMTIQVIPVACNTQ